MRVNWSRAGALLIALRTVVLTLGGFGALTAGAFLWSSVAGFVVLGVALLIIEALTGPERPGDGGRRA